MPSDMCRCHSLAGGTSSRAGRTIVSHITRGSMRVKRRLPNTCHRENACVDPGLQSFECVSRTTIEWSMVLEIGHDTLCTRYGPASQGDLVGFAQELSHRFVFARDRERWFCHVHAS